MRVLFLTGDIPYPTNTGARIRTFNLIANAKDEAQVTVATMVHDDAYAARLAVLRDVCAGVELVSKPPEQMAGFYGGLFRSLFSARPFIVDKHQYQPYIDKVRTLINSRRFDLVHCDSISLAPLVMGHLPIPAVLTEHNMEAIIWQRYVEEEQAFARRWYMNAQYRKVAAFEAAACRAVDLVITVSDDDRRRLQESYQVSHSIVVPNGVDTGYFAPRAVPYEPDTMVFTGSMDWRPNQDAMLWFYEAIWPLVTAKRPNAKLYVVGRKPPEKIIAIGKADPRIVVTGTVDDVRDFTAKGAVYVVPLRIGGGSRLKILEALAMQKAIVSTTIGAEGLTLASGRDLLIADEPASFASHVIALFDDPERRASLGKNGYETVRATYDWKSVARLQLVAWQEAIKRRHQKP